MGKMVMMVDPAVAGHDPGGEGGGVLPDEDLRKLLGHDVVDVGCRRPAQLLAAVPFFAAERGGGRVEVNLVQVAEVGELEVGRALGIKVGVRGGRREGAGGDGLLAPHAHEQEQEAQASEHRVVLPHIPARPSFIPGIHWCCPGLSIRMGCLQVAK